MGCSEYRRPTPWGPTDGLRRYRRVATRVRVGFSPCAGGPTSEAAAPEWNPRLYGRASPRGPRRRLPVHTRGGRGRPTPGTRFPVYSPAGNRMRGARLRASPHPSFPLPAASTRALSPAWARSAPSTSPSRVHRTAPNTEPVSRGDAPGPPVSPRVTEKQKAGPGWLAGWLAEISHRLEPVALDSSSSRSELEATPSLRHLALACLTPLLACATGEGGRPSDRLR